MKITCPVTEPGQWPLWGALTDLGLATEGQLVETEAWGSMRPCTGSRRQGVRENVGSRRTFLAGRKGRGSFPERAEGGLRKEWKSTRGQEGPGAPGLGDTCSSWTPRARAPASRRSIPLSVVSERLTCTSGPCAEPWWRPGIQSGGQDRPDTRQGGP